ncbi:MAG: methyltransferase domain-containing protein [Candidatus Aenigmarchaeota archaeon]|nr:methyltransferase domain-containing protein [Candidatus Aenigmarchaeota archaeon]
MSLYEEKQALPFDVYFEFLQKLKVEDEELHRYLCEMGFVIKSKEYYDNSVRRAKYIESNDYSREVWEILAERVKSNDIVQIDTYCSQLKFLQNSIVKEGVIIDLGCGSGDTTEWIRRNTQAEVIGIDYSRNMLKEHKKLQSDLVLGDCERLPIKNCSIDQALLTWFTSNTDRRKILDEVKRVLKPEGEVRLSSIGFVVGVCSINAKTYDSFLRTFMDKFYEDPEVRKKICLNMEFRYCRDKSIQEELENLARLGLEESYEFSRFPVMPRGSSEYFVFNVPMTVVGKKPKA